MHDDPFRLKFNIQSNISFPLTCMIMIHSYAFFACDDGDSTVPDFGLPPQLDLSIIVACNDGIDNDQDNLIDYPEDPGCLGLQDIDERDSTEGSLCEDLLDNDHDGLIDDQDPGCLLSDGLEEYSAPVAPQCSNGEDDDGDGYIDYPIDESCEGPRGDDEARERTLTACNNARDDDADGFVDFPYDPGCASPEDQDETDQFQPSMLPQCNDGVDNDQDGYTDLADAQCTTPSDPRERRLEEEAIPACSNGLDDDGDGLIDFIEDLGCIGPGGPSEIDHEELPACADGLDNDQDGYIDYPDEPGCASRGDDREEDPPILPACLDGLDNDQDGSIDYPSDVGCESSADTDERGACVSSPAVIELSSDMSYRGTSRQGRFHRVGSCGGQGAPELTAIYSITQRLRQITFQTRAIPGEEDDGWETTLYARSRCDDAHLELACTREPIDGEALNTLTLDEPPLGPVYLLIDGATGSGGSFQLDVIEVPIEACQNQLDDDGDGLIDFPSDPGCEDTLDDSEVTPFPPPACYDDIDNDLDGLIDYPLDVGCRVASDQDERDECGQGLPVGTLTTPPTSLSGITRLEGTTSEHQGSCGGIGIERVLRYDNPSHASLEIYLSRTDGEQEFAYLYARAGECTATEEELNCQANEIGGPPLQRPEEDEGAEQDETDQDNSGMREDLWAPNPAYGTSMRLQIESAPQGPIYLFIDHDLEGFPYQLIVKRTPLPPRCIDGIDNDRDGAIDADDSGCSGPEDESERSPEASPACADQLDNDMDGWIDYPLDPGCAYHGGTSEVDPLELPSCFNEVDDDGNGLTDYPLDPGCSARGDLSESNLPIPPECANLIDDDQDGYFDFPYDPGCHAQGDLKERTPLQPVECADQVDNDLNGLIDYPSDPNCYAAGDLLEQSLGRDPLCSDGVDNDQDGFTDFPYDPGCEARGDESEVDPVLPPACANGVDDDLNQRIDWPDDPGCFARSDQQEDQDGPTLPRCIDGVDNDNDGAIDLDDPECRSRFDQTEDTPEPDEPSWSIALRECMDGIDNDGDGDTDWPNDPGCGGQGASCEQGGFQRCWLDDQETDSSCVDLLSNPQHCGACGHHCSSEICENGYCLEQANQLRARLMYCGSTLRPITTFLTGPLDNAPLVINAGCDPDDTVQALLITRTGRSGVSLNAERLRGYLERGGQLITERGISAHVMNELFDLNLNQGPERGDCRTNIQPVVLQGNDDPLWTTISHAPPPEGESGCGNDLRHFPSIVHLGGWDLESSSLAYFNHGRGRIWLVEADWRNLSPSMTQESLELMAALILGGGRRSPSVALPECMDRFDNDQDGFIDLFDRDCRGPRDVTESPTSALNDLPAACSDGQDNDEDGWTDFPFDEGCESAGDLNEAEIEVTEGATTYQDPECSDDLDNDQNGLMDWPYDPHCDGRGDLTEAVHHAQPVCANLQDDDFDGFIDFPADPDCLAFSWPSELPPSRGKLVAQGLVIDVGRGAGQVTQVKPGCANRTDDDGDGLVDYPADPECLSPRDLDERGESHPFSVRDRLSQIIATLPQCSDGLDNDLDGFTDLADLSCQSPQQIESEGDVEETPICGDGVDNDQDGLVDWPEDSECLSRGDTSENTLSCDHLELTELTGNGPHLIDVYANDESDIARWEQSTSPICAHPSQAGQIRLIEQTEDGPLTLTIGGLPVIPQQSQLAVALQLQKGCGVNAQVILCEQRTLNTDDHRDRMIEIPWLSAGQYLLVIAPAAPPGWESLAEEIELPPDPAGHIARSDITSICWQDAGGDTFDCMGRAEVLWREEISALDVSLGIHRLELEPGFSLIYSSERPHPNIWRVRYWTQGRSSGDDAPSLTLRGNLGHDASTIATTGDLDLSVVMARYHWFTNHLEQPTKPPALLFMLPSNQEELAALSEVIRGDEVEIATGELTFPLTYYIVSSYLPREQLLEALRNDLDLFAGAQSPAATPLQISLEVLR